MLAVGGGTVNRQDGAVDWFFLVESLLGLLFVAGAVTLFVLDAADRRARRRRRGTSLLRLAVVVLGLLFLIALALRFAGI